ncbi:MAG: galactokinase, partial [Bacteroidales bacterium]|nr:galactokinase [Bacteroidales bacterium]
MDMQTRIHERFLASYGDGGTMYAAAGRINLIGEHTDYNGGYVFPGAIDKGIVAEIKPNGSDRVHLHSVDYDATTSFGLNEEDKPAEAWACYIFGVCREILKRGGKVEGFDAVFAGDVPLGAGLSSSAALESCFAFALNDLFQNGIDKFELARIGQSTEHNYCGVMCGIMDQFASCFGKAGSLIRLNCKTLEYKYFPFDPKGYKLVLVDTCVKHELASSAYNFRRQSCERAAAAIKKNHPEIDFLSDCKRVWLDEVRD